MTRLTEKLIKSIENNDSILFTELLRAPKEEIDYTMLDAALLKSKKFPFETKLYYAKVYERPLFLEDLMQDITLNYTYYSYNEILYIAINYIKKPKNKRFYYVEAFANTTISEIPFFYYSILKNEISEDFFAAIKQTKSSTLKIKACLYLDPKLISELYLNNTDFINAIYNSNLSSKEKIEYLLDLNDKIELNKNDVEHLKEVIISISESYYEKLNQDLKSYDEELVTYGENKAETKLANRISIIDSKKGRSYLHK